MQWMIVLVTALTVAFPALDFRAAPPVQPVAAADTTRLLFVVGPEGNEARYRVREQLARFSFPNDAVGSTRRIQGQIAFHPDGRIARDVSRFVVDLASLQTDQERRDNFVRRNTLVTDTFPTLTLVPRELPGLGFPLPTAGERRFRMIADMTLRGVTRPTTWDVTATFAPDGVRGVATTSFTFANFEIPKPRVAIVLSVEDTIRLEYQFRLVPAAAAVTQ